MYGSVTNVAALSSTWTDNGEFTNDDTYVEGTNPSLMQVEAWLEQMSSVIDSAIANEGFVTPLTNPTAIADASAIVEGVVADLVHASHKSGRFFVKKALESGISPMMAIRSELTQWVVDHTISFKTLGILNASGAVGAHTSWFDVL